MVAGDADLDPENLGTTDDDHYSSDDMAEGDESEPLTYDAGLERYIDGNDRDRYGADEGGYPDGNHNRDDNDNFVIDDTNDQDEGYNQTPDGAVPDQHYGDDAAQTSGEFA